MKQYLILLVLLINFNLFSQNEFDYPVENYKETQGKIVWFNESHDSVWLDLDVLGVDYEDYNKPGIYTVTAHKQEGLKYYKVVILSVEDSSYRMGTSCMPDICSIWEEVDSSQQVPYKNNGQLMGAGGIIADSSYVLVEKCEQEFFKSDNDTVTVDTIYFDGYFENSLYEFSNFGIWSCDYHYEFKHGTERMNYTIGELDNQIVIGDKIGIKYIGDWKYGAKHGKWLFYDKSGLLTKKEIYKKGKLKKTKTY